MLTVFKLTLTAPRLEEAFQRVSDSPRVASCSIEVGECQVRFLAPERDGAALVERIYAEGGLVWCSRHAFPVAPSEPRLSLVEAR